MSARPTVHATCLVIGEAGVLVRGPSGAGKSSFAAALIEHASERGRFARLVADDRVRLHATNGRLVARVPDEIAGLVERRGLGIRRAPFIAGAVVRLVVDLETTVARMPEEADLACVIEGVRLARLGVAATAPDCVALVYLALNSSQARDCVSSALAFEGRDGKITDKMDSPSNSRSDGARAALRGPLSERNEFCAETQ